MEDATDAPIVSEDCNVASANDTISKNNSEENCENEVKIASDEINNSGSEQIEPNGKKDEEIPEVKEAQNAATGAVLEVNQSVLVGDDVVEGQWITVDKAEQGEIATEEKISTEGIGVTNNTDNVEKSPDPAQLPAQDTKIDTNTSLIKFGDFVPTEQLKQSSEGATTVTTSSKTTTLEKTETVEETKDVKIVDKVFERSKSTRPGSLEEQYNALMKDVERLQKMPKDEVKILMAKYDSCDPAVFLKQKTTSKGMEECNLCTYQGANLSQHIYGKHLPLELLPIGRQPSTVANNLSNWLHILMWQLNCRSMVALYRKAESERCLLSVYHKNDRVSIIIALSKCLGFEWFEKRMGFLSNLTDCSTLCKLLLLLPPNARNELAVMPAVPGKSYETLNNQMLPKLMEGVPAPKLARQQPTRPVKPSKPALKSMTSKTQKVTGKKNAIQLARKIRRTYQARPAALRNRQGNQQTGPWLQKSPRGSLGSGRNSLRDSFDLSTRPAFDMAPQPFEYSNYSQNQFQDQWLGMADMQPSAGFLTSWDTRNPGGMGSLSPGLNYGSGMNTGMQESRLDSPFLSHSIYESPMNMGSSSGQGLLPTLAQQGMMSIGQPQGRFQQTGMSESILPMPTGNSKQSRRGVRSRQGDRGSRKNQNISKGETFHRNLHDVGVSGNFKPSSLGKSKPFNFGTVPGFETGPSQSFSNNFDSGAASQYSFHGGTQIEGAAETLFSPMAERSSTWQSPPAKRRAAEPVYFMDNYPTESQENRRMSSGGHAPQQRKQNNSRKNRRSSRGQGQSRGGNRQASRGKDWQFSGMGNQQTHW